MNEAGKFEVYKKKLQGICDENNLIYTFRANEYPIKLTVRPTGENNDQMSLLEKPELDNEGMGEDAELIFTYKDGALFFRISDTFAVSEALFSKLKNLFRNMHSVWLQFFFRKIVEKKLLSTLPEIEDSIERECRRRGGQWGRLLAG